MTTIATKTIVKKIFDHHLIESSHFWLMEKFGLFLSSVIWSAIKMHYYVMLTSDYNDSIYATHITFTLLSCHAIWEPRIIKKKPQTKSRAVIEMMITNDTHKWNKSTIKFNYKTGGFFSPSF